MNSSVALVSDAAKARAALTPLRRELLERLREPNSAASLAGQLALPRQKLAYHLRVLEEAGLIANEREGKHRRCHLKREALDSAAGWLDFNRRFWSGSFDRLDAHLKTPKKEKKK